MKEERVRVYMPMLAAILGSIESKNGSPLTEEEVNDVVNRAPFILMDRQDAEKFAAHRGRDLDPDNAWQDWCLMRQDVATPPN